MRIDVTVRIDASPAAVWDFIQDISSHTQWMRDARSIEFLGHQTQGVGARFACRTKVGPLALDDVMEITEWSPGHKLGVRHTGLVSGEGTFLLDRLPDGSVDFSWQERLRFPWRLGGVVGEVLAKPLLAAIWKGNLRRLKQLVEQGGG